MRIGISGVSSTGKTTLSKALSERLGIPLITSGMKDVFKRIQDVMGPGSKVQKFENLTSGSKLDFQMEMIELRWKEELNTDVFIADGTPLDVSAFWMEWLSRLTIDRRPFDSIIRRTEYLIQESLDRYDIIFQLQRGVIPVEDDNRRITDEVFLRKMDYILQGETDRIGLAKIRVIQSASLSDRVNEVLEFLKINSSTW